MIGQKIILKKLSIENMVSMCSIYMIWQEYKPSYSFSFRTVLLTT
jgi:hypothetical protein